MSLVRCLLSTLGLVGALCASGCAGAVWVDPPAIASASPKRWQQYCTSAPPGIHSAAGVNAWLSQQGDQGWELVSRSDGWYCFKAP